MVSDINGIAKWTDNITPKWKFIWYDFTASTTDIYFQGGKNMIMGLGGSFINNKIILPQTGLYKFSSSMNAWNPYTPSNISGTPYYTSFNFEVYVNNVKKGFLCDFDLDPYEGQNKNSAYDYYFLNAGDVVDFRRQGYESPPITPSSTSVGWGSLSSGNIEVDLIK